MIEDRLDQGIFGKSPRIVHECIKTKISKEEQLFFPVFDKFIRKFSKFSQAGDKVQSTNLKSPSTLRK